MAADEEPIEHLAPNDPRPRYRELELRLSDGALVAARDDAYSDRVRCDHPPPCSATALATGLEQAARERGRGRIVLLAPVAMRAELVRAGMALEATMPGFYAGEQDCDVFGKAIDPSRARLALPAEVAEVDALIAERAEQTAKPRPAPESERATVEDAAAIAELVTATFAHYPTPTGVPAYVAELIDEGTPFRIVRRDGCVVACASADLVRSARTAELTDCATRPSERGRGLMQGILSGLMADLRQMGYPTAFTLARAAVAGVNLAFWRLGFVWRGQMAASCRIGGGIEDMNVWSRRL